MDTSETLSDGMQAQSLRLHHVCQQQKHPENRNKTLHYGSGLNVHKSCACITSIQRKEISEIFVEVLEIHEVGPTKKLRTIHWPLLVL